MNPVESLIIFSLIVASLTVIFLPRKGLLAKWKHTIRSTERVLIEDALKHLYDREYNQLGCTLQSIAGNLEINSDKATNLVERLEKLGLINSKDGKLSLTPKGRSYALRVIRVHRLWEKYLSEKTGVPEIDWHDKAEWKEHELTPEQADDLAASIGNPLFDPHGDPIPTSDGRIPRKEGVPLSSLKEGNAARIIHIEDEPKAVYAQLLALDLHLGSQIIMIENTRERIKFESDGDEKVLAPIFAANVTVKLFERKTDVQKNFITLSNLKVGEKGTVLKISNALRGQERRRLMDFGIVPGAEIAVEMKSPSGDPTAYLIRDAIIAFRKNQSDHIFIKK
ncbi:iron-dependent repressor IdeR [bacterium BMS3Abin04]|nr:iron-dependent repressor IdeR [bacterium BMS3Abin04]